MPSTTKKGFDHNFWPLFKMVKLFQLVLLEPVVHFSCALIHPVSLLTHWKKTKSNSSKPKTKEKSFQTLTWVSFPFHHWPFSTRPLLHAAFGFGPSILVLSVLALLRSFWQMKLIALKLKEVLLLRQPASRRRALLKCWSCLRKRGVRFWAHSHSHEAEELDFIRKKIHIGVAFKNSIDMDFVYFFYSHPLIWRVYL